MLSSEFLFGSTGSFLVGLACLHPPYGCKDLQLCRTSQFFSGEHRRTCMAGHHSYTHLHHNEVRKATPGKPSTDNWESWASTEWLYLAAWMTVLS